MSYELRASGFSRIVCHLSEQQLSELRTMLFLLGPGKSASMIVDTYKHEEWTVPNNIYISDGNYLVARCSLNEDQYNSAAEGIIPVVWAFKLISEIPF